ncbi:MAG: type II toxin-antitoxin system VapB family antitoxin [Cellulomonadaceae bacterium]|jgi:hypothetical protein|nr:type II toxin-antitoxin system VapB family antitoxin [Cellulomonadaceae bacterium]
MSLNIKNPRVVALVDELAQRTGQGKTAALEGAVESKLKELDGVALREARAARIEKTIADIHRRVKPDPGYREWADRHMYDEAGLPVW